MFQEKNYNLIQSKSHFATFLETVGLCLITRRICEMRKYKNQTENFFNCKLSNITRFMVEMDRIQTYSIAQHIK